MSLMPRNLTNQLAAEDKHLESCAKCRERTNANNYVFKAACLKGWKIYTEA